jgi:hypothetical protein
VLATSVLVVAALACCVPTLWATRIDPTIAARLPELLLSR